MILLALCGPTAAGKTEAALEVARQLRAEIVSADSMQVYRGLDVGTAKPSRALRDQIPHHLVDVAEVEEVYSAGRFAKEADAILRQLDPGNPPVLLCGGTMLYVRALLRGLLDAPSNPELRQHLEEQTTEELAARLREADRSSAERIHPHDRVRLIRALEITLETGTPASRLRAAHSQERSRHKAHMVALVPAKETLHHRIDTRIDRMIEGGLLDETEWLLARAQNRPLHPLRALGYRQMAEHIRGEIRLDEATAKLRSATRAFARRQLAWIRQEPDVAWANSTDQAKEILLRACDRAA